MLYLSKPKKVYLYLGIVDFRKQAVGLAQLVEHEFPKGALQTSWFVFVSRDKKKVKLLYWRGAGLCLWQYRLEDEKFRLSSERPSLHYGVSWRSLSQFLSGYNIFEERPHRNITVKRYS